MRLLKNLLRPVKTWLLFQRECYLDGRRYMKCVPQSQKSSEHSTAHLEGHIIRRYHVIEKGLSMPDFRPRFGEEMVSQLAGMVRQWELEPGQDCASNNQITAAKAVLQAYRDKHQTLGIDVNDILGGEQWMECAASSALGGVREYHLPSLPDREALTRMLNSRASIRHFDSTRIPARAITERAIAAAIQSPSVCNRQTWRAHLFEGDDAQRMLALQDGNRGFGHTIPAVLIITSDLRYFTSIHERYQAWIDGGMFSMSLLLALHAEGLGAVALNWCVSNHRDQELRRVADIPDYERIIMIIGFGHPAQDCFVPISQRRPVSSILKIHTD